MNWFEALPSLHFVRPQWLWALLLLPLAGWWWRRRQQRGSVWQGLVDPHLLLHLLERGNARRGVFALLAGLLALALAVIALAGPAWRQVEHPLWQTRAPLVVALDLSSAMLANDLPPSRLAQARAKLATLLRERAGGQVGLVAYAGDAFTIAPLTDDAANIALFLDALSPDVMPVDGQRGDRAIEWSAQLLARAGFDQGRILLLTDHADADAKAAATRAAGDGYRVSVLGLGTAQGAPYRDAQGRIGQARLDVASLRALAAAAEGDYATLTADAADLRALDVLDPQQTMGMRARGRSGATWRDEGYWLLPPLVLLALLAFRRRGVVAVLLLCAVLPVRAAEVEGTPWRRPDQVAHARMERGADAYRRGQFEQAAHAYAGMDTADAHYNRGNALAKAGRYEEAVAAYDRALELEPVMPDALANKETVENAMKRKRESKPGENQGQQESGGEQQTARRSFEGTPRPQPGKPGQGEGPQRSEQSAKPTTQQPPDSAQSRGDSEQQQRADAAQHKRMQEALQRAEQDGQRAHENERDRGTAETPAERERRLANEAWLKRIPDDPGGLLRAKLRLEHERRQRDRGQ